ncbi:unnamed protein product [Rotaria sp. Silwood1]|nr:unnamed protein product [Rotaria sp. Silwood1]
MDIDLQPLPAISYTTIGGIIDLYLFTGPTTQDVIQQYWDVIGKPTMPPYWSLGFHLCRYGYNNIDNLRAVIQRMHDAKFPYDVQWTDIDAMSSHLDFTYDQKNFNGLPDLVHSLQSEGKHYVNIIDCGISSTQPSGTYPPYDEGLKRAIFMTKFNSTEPITGEVWPGLTVFPDFTNASTIEWWTHIAATFHDTIPFDGIWIDMNEPSNFIDGSHDGCTNNSLDNPPFVPHPAAFSWTAQQIMKQALITRYSLIPFWYTLHYRAAIASETLLQPLHFEFFNDNKTLGIDQQFLIGRAILVSPNLVSKATTVNVYIPEDVWYQFSSGVKVKVVGVFTDLDAPLEKINVHVRGGFIIPMQMPGANLMVGRGNPFTLLVAQSALGNASGNLFWDDGDSIEFGLREQRVASTTVSSVREPINWRSIRLDPPAETSVTSVLVPDFEQATIVLDNEQYSQYAVAPATPPPPSYYKVIDSFSKATFSNCPKCNNQKSIFNAQYCTQCGYGYL